jgi:isopenicillin N synthase-like dioxygenase
LCQLDVTRISNIETSSIKTFIIGREVPADHPEAGAFLTGPNLWPDLPKEKFQDVVLAYQAKMVELAGVIVRTLVRGLPEEWGCPPDALDGLMDDPAIPMRMLHYGPVKEQNSRQFGGISCLS